MEAPFARAWFRTFNLRPRELKLTWKLIGFALLGVVLLLVQGMFSATDKESRADKGQMKAQASKASREEVDELLSYESDLSTTLASVLEKIDGAGKVYVSVSVDSSPAKVYAKEELTRTKNTQEGGIGGDHRSSAESETSSRISTLGGMGSKDVPVVRVLKPEVIGVLVIAEGASDPNVKTRLAQAVQVALALPPHKITILPAVNGDIGVKGDKR